MEETPEFLAKSTEELAAARGERKAKFQVGGCDWPAVYIYTWFGLGKTKHDLPDIWNYVIYRLRESIIMIRKYKWEKSYLH